MCIRDSITLDKMDKIGVEGVASELAQDGYPQENIDKYLDLFKLLEQTRDCLLYTSLFVDVF